MCIHNNQLSKQSSILSDFLYMQLSSINYNYGIKNALYIINKYSQNYIYNHNAGNTI